MMARRKCLTCLKLFESERIDIRICDGCRATNTKLIESAIPIAMPAGGPDVKLHPINEARYCMDADYRKDTLEN